jgi:hypothetical protein
MTPHQSITITLPETVLERLTQVATATHQSVEVLVTQSVMNNLPPAVPHASPVLQTELLQMQGLEIPQLLEIAQSQVNTDQFRQHERLLLKNEVETLTADEQVELSTCRQTADEFMLRRAYAWAILRWRGYRLPPLQELSLP